jgi:hypothetical protein
VNGFSLLWVKKINYHFTSLVFPVKSVMLASIAPAGKKIPFVWGEWGYPVEKSASHKPNMGVSNDTTLMARASEKNASHKPNMGVSNDNSLTARASGKDPQSVDEATQSAFTQRQLLLGSLYEVPANVLYSWKGALTEHNEQSYELGFGFRRSDGSFRPSYHAIAKLHQALKGYSFRRRLPSDPEDYLLVFENAQGKQLLAAWTTQQTHRVQWQTHQVSVSDTPTIIAN